MNWFRNLFADKTFGAIRSGQWPKLRDWYFRNNPHCEICEKRAKEIHHILPFFLFPEKELDSNNLVALCRYCHFSFGHFFSWKSYNEKIREDITRIKNRP